MPTNAAPVVAARNVPAGRGWQWIVEAWTLTAGYRPLFVGLVVAFMALAIVASVVPVVGTIVMGLFTPVLQAGLIVGCDALHRGEPLKVDHLFAGFERHTSRLVMLGGVSVIAGFVMLLVGAGDRRAAGAGPASERYSAGAGSDGRHLHAHVAGGARRDRAEPAVLHGRVVRRAADRVARSRGRRCHVGQFQRLPHQHVAFPRVEHRSARGSQSCRVCRSS